MISGRDFLAVADRLARGTNDGEWRTAVSRAYHAAYHVAHKLLTDCRFVVPYGERAHAYLWQRLSNAGDTSVAKAGRTLDVLRRDRNRADYDLWRTIRHADVVSLVQEAKAIVQSLEVAVADSTIKTQITDTMKTYERDVLREVTWQP
jgi:uncharacterized protein (UPF0332 family)